MANPLRIGYLVSQYPAISHTFILREVIALRKLGFEISVASVNSADRSAQNLTLEECQEANHTYYLKQVALLRILWLHAATFFRYPARYMSSLIFAIRLAGFDLGRMLFGLFYFVEAVLVVQWMKSNRTAHLHVHFATPAAMVGLIASRLGGTQLSITVHGPDEFYDVTQYQMAAKIDGCSFLCVISRFARSQLMKLSPAAQWSKFEITPLGVDTDAFRPSPDKPDTTPFQILCVGRLVPAKGQQILLGAAELLIQRGLNVRVRLVGDGPDRASLESASRRSALAGKVCFEGSVNQDRIRQFYEQADAFVLPSFAEGVPVVLMEAMSMGIPCISTRITGIPELIRDQVDGLLVTPSDLEELAAAIERLMSDAGLRQRLSEAGRRRIQANYRLDSNIQQLAEVFQRRVRPA